MLNSRFNWIINTPFAMDDSFILFNIMKYRFIGSV
jgi:hypothetical protein